MIAMPKRGTGVAISGVVPSLVLSLLASAAATYLLRRFLSTEAASRDADQESGQGRPPTGNVSVAVPIVVLTIISGNRVGGGRRGMPPPFFLPFLIARLVRMKGRKQRGWQRRKG